MAGLAGFGRRSQSHCNYDSTSQRAIVWRELGVKRRRYAPVACSRGEGNDEMKRQWTSARKSTAWDATPAATISPLDIGPPAESGAVSEQRQAALQMHSRAMRSCRNRDGGERATAPAAVHMCKAEFIRKLPEGERALSNHAAQLYQKKPRSESEVAARGAAKDSQTRLQTIGVGREPARWEHRPDDFWGGALAMLTKQAIDHAHYRRRHHPLLRRCTSRATP